MMMILVLPTISQTTKKIDKAKIEPFAYSDISSSYVWRGALFNNGPTILPIVGINYGKFSLGVVSAIGTTNCYNEFDPYISFSQNWFKISLTDYYTDVTNLTQDYFNYSDTIGYHNTLADVTFGNPEKTPFSITVSTVLYGGLDQYSDGKQRYTTYMELNYAKPTYQLFVGGLSGKSDFYLNNECSISTYNVGVKYIKNIPFNNNKSLLPLTTAVICNPIIKKVYFTLTISF
jgi:hypothetical protein